jgi:acetolactate synthase regulatory subunit
VSHHHVHLTVRDAPAVLDRVVQTCRSRQCTIVALTFHAGDRHRPGRVELGLDAPARAVDLAVERLRKLVDVELVAYSQPRSVASRTA